MQSRLATLQGRWPLPCAMMNRSERRLTMQLWPKMGTISTKLGKDERGATAIEYGLIAAGISIAIIASVFAIGDELSNLFSNVATALDPVARCVEVGSNCKK